MPLPAAVVIGMMMMTNSNPVPGQNWIGFRVPDMTIEEAMATEWQVLSDIPFLLRARPTSCGRDPAGGQIEPTGPPQLPFVCWVELPIQQDVHFVQVKREGAEWSPKWQMADVPCGYFIGEQVFRNITEKLGWPLDPTQVGVACSPPDAPQTPPIVLPQPGQPVVLP